MKLGPYEIQSALGAGGMGEVYRARDTRLDRIVAIKVLPPHLSGNLEARERFDREARAISSLSHANICTLYDVGHQNGTDYLVMEYLEGETLADRLRKGALPLQQVHEFSCKHGKVHLLLARTEAGIDKKICHFEYRQFVRVASKNSTRPRGLLVKPSME
jgi:serine/threonine protein kinase